MFVVSRSSVERSPVAVTKNDLHSETLTDVFANIVMYVDLYFLSLSISDVAYVT